ncbi:hypothetical protein L7F22_042443 [Adiantum nelumboides]|nr:hypothetical protein [Adiantum nelumboides]
MASGEGQSNPSTFGDAGGDHNEDFSNEYGPPLPTQEELRETEHRRLVGEATNLMLNFAKDPKLAKYMSETAFQDVQAQWKATTTSPSKPDSKKQYSEKELEEEIDARLARILGAQKQGKKHDRKRKKSIDFPGYLGSQSTFDKAKKHKKRAAVPSSSSSSYSSSESSEEERRSKKRSKRHRHGKSKRKTRKSRSRRVDDSSTDDSSTDSLDSEDGHFYANKKNFYKAKQYDFLEDKSKKVREFKEGGQSIKCHVMEVESFESEDVARLMNDWFVSIKVDREERPDVDKVYMTYVQATQGGGGWPMSVFLTPELKPMVGGTYFPPDDKYGRPGFKSILRRVKEVWDTKKDAIRHSGELIVQQLAEATTASASSAELAPDSSQQAVDLCAKQLAKGYDAKVGGFGGPPKFPRPVELYVIMRQYRRLYQAGKTVAASKALEMALYTLRCMAKGGIHDHIGGGFHRYSVDEYWHVPHFEKMLYDQGQLVNAYLDALSITKSPLYANVARDILDYLKRDMLDPEGGIYSAEDADSLEKEGLARKKEGAFYVWTSQEIEDILGTENAEPFMKFYYVKHNGNCDLSRLSDPHGEFAGKNVVIERMELDELSEAYKRPVEEFAVLLGSCRQELFDYRSKRPRPHLDDKVIVAWNGLAISAFARASRMLTIEPKGVSHHFPVVETDLTEYMHIAERASSFIKEKLFDEGTRRLKRSFRKGPSMAPGFLDDYAFLIAGLLDLFEAGGQTKWLFWAIQLQETQA